jgi:hypothetical protein
MPSSAPGGIAHDQRRVDCDNAITYAVPAWTRTRNWTTALLAFKIHFGDRLPSNVSTEETTHTENRTPSI